MATETDLAAARAFAVTLAKQTNINQAVVLDKGNGNVYIVPVAAAKTNADKLDQLAIFAPDGTEKVINQNPLVTFEVTAIRSGANQHQFAIWRMEDGEAVQMAGQGTIEGTHAEAIAAGQKAITELVNQVNAGGGLQVVK